MTIVDIHPEELIDKLASGELSRSERERLDAHLGVCAVCRFEVTVRADFAEDTLYLEARPRLSQSEAVPKARELPVASPPAATKRRAPLSRRPRTLRRWLPLLLAAALALGAGGALAAVLTGTVPTPWGLFKPGPAPVAKANLKGQLTPRVAAPLAASREPSEPSDGALALAGASGLPAGARPVSGAGAGVAPAVEAQAHPSRSSSALRAAPAPRGVDSNLAVAAEAAPTSNRLVPSDPAASRSNSAAALFADANRARRDGNADRAVALYRSLQSRYPASSESALSRALLAQLLLDRGSPEAALAGFDRYLADDSPALSAEAWVGRARALEQLKRTAQAAQAWREVESRFPGSIHARLAASRLLALGTR